jgi:hypothetical protein
VQHRRPLRLRYRHRRELTEPPRHLLIPPCAGFTSISVPGGKWFVDVTLRDAVNTGML